MPRVLAAMSGGVDSSVAAALLAQRGFEVIGVTLNQWPKSLMANATGRSGCCTPRTIDDARRVCRTLGVAHYVIDYRKEFERAVISPWTRSYLAGETPNPCVMCNRAVRFGELLFKAAELGADFIATGHYARIARDQASGRYRLLTAIDKKKDQSYVLHVLGQRQLERVMFPLGELTKPRVRDLARGMGLSVADKPESQEICFVPDNDYVSVVRRRGSSGPGVIEDSEGRALGRHDGIEAFTVGQRRRLGIDGSGGARYVRRIDPARNAVVVGEREQAFATHVRVRDVHWVAGDCARPPDRLSVKTRYRIAPERARFAQRGAREVTLAFDAPTWAPAPGQSAVFYAGDEVLGGGAIAETWSA